MNQILSAQALSNAAQAQFPEGDYGHENYQPALDTLLRGLLEEAKLEPVGLYAASSRLIASLKRRRQLVAHIEKHPETADIKIERPVFILGFPRTGTTLLHNLFASDPANRSIRLWEMRDPFAESEQDIAKAMEEMQALVESAYRLSPRLVDIHPLKAEWPDECSWLFRNSFASMVNAFSYFIPGYVQWMLARDMTEDYEYFRKQLQAILSLRPGSPLVLKDPCHIWHSPELLKTFPDARIIQLHRDPQQVAPSFISLCLALQEGAATIRSLPEITDYCLNMLTAGLEQMLAAREQLPQEHFIDLGYHELVANPEAALERLYGGLEMNFSSQAQTGIRQWLSRGSRHTGKHRYQLSDFGLTAQDVEQRFSAYNEYFVDILKEDT
uniref:Sulfotransferase family protein n=1 Tax=Candidatus Kentrum sp. UNK TaxID=2126344 RepID=A0A451AYH2_9GAMM|nr:MAG: Sulfotransferase family protein [Candidatus Kentron sp. UNK]VFK71070.1 MAG: Sulfotransferase family protein [Candidatus Kentron sp. UNK]